MSHEEIMSDLQSPQENKRLDLVSVVRCEYCKYWYPFPDKLFGYCRRKYWDSDGQYRLMIETAHDDYCSYGETR